MRFFRLAVLSLLPLVLPSQSQNAEPEKATLEGVVVNTATGQPVRKAHLVLRMTRQPATPQNAPAPGRLPAFSAISDSGGRFGFAKVDPGEYQVEATRQGFTFREVAAKDVGKLGSITLAPGEQRSGILLRLTPLGAITGRVADEDGEPIRGVQIAVMNYQYSFGGRQLVERRTALSDDLGEYRIFDVPKGRFYLRAAYTGPKLGADEAEAYGTCFYPMASEVTGASPIELAAGQVLREINFTLRITRFATIRGRLIAPENSSARYVSWMLPSSGSGPGRVEQDGRFELVGVPPGAILVSGSYMVTGRRVEARMPLQVGSDDISGIELAPIPGMEVTGKIRVDGTSTEKNLRASVVLSAPGQSYYLASVQNDGSFVFNNVNAAVYQVSPNFGARDLYLKAVYWGETEITDSALDLTNGVPARATLTLVFGVDSGTISGTVTDSESGIAVPATVVLVPTGSHKSKPFYRSAVTNNGRFNLFAVGPGDYMLFAWDTADPNLVIYEPDFLKPYEAAGQSIHILANEKQTVDLKVIVNKQAQ